VSDANEDSNSEPNIEQSRAKRWADMAQLLGCSPDDDEGPFMVVRAYARRIKHLEDQVGVDKLEDLMRHAQIPVAYNCRELSLMERVVCYVTRIQHKNEKLAQKARDLNDEIMRIARAMNDAGFPRCASVPPEPISDDQGPTEVQIELDERIRFGVRLR
jgi:hypothetical protein